jgi:hypothetical protein
MAFGCIYKGKGKNNTPKIPLLAISSNLRAAARKFQDIANIAVFEAYFGYVLVFTIGVSKV